MNLVGATTILKTPAPDQGTPSPDGASSEKPLNEKNLGQLREDAPRSEERVTTARAPGADSRVARALPKCWVRCKGRRRRQPSPLPKPDRSALPRRQTRQSGVLASRYFDLVAHGNARRSAANTKSRARKCRFSGTSVNRFLTMAIVCSRVTSPGKHTSSCPAQSRETRIPSTNP